MNPQLQKGNYESMDAILLQPPPGDLTGPYPALCYLKSHAASNGFRVQVRDIGIEAFCYLSDDHQLGELMARSGQMRKTLEAKPYMSASEKEHYLLLLKAMGFSLTGIGGFKRGISAFKDKQTFYNYDLYHQAFDYLESFYNLISSVYYPTAVSPCEYPTAWTLKTAARIFEHESLHLNPYVDFYETVLFPDIARSMPKVVGISMVFGDQSTQALILGRLIRKRFPGIHVTMGGAYLSQWMMSAGKEQICQIFECMDSVICGEGELPFTNLLDRVVHNKPLKSMPNLIYRDPESGQMARFEDMIYTDITDQPAPDYSDIHPDAYLCPQLIIPYCITRGCYWGKCVFCQNRYGDYQVRRYQTVPIEKAVSDMTALEARYHSNHFNFSNDVIDPAYLKNFSQALLDSGKKFIWNTDLRAEKAFTPELCKLMAAAGLNCVAIGFESGSQKILDAMNKGKKTDNTREVMKHFYDAGIATQAMGIFGFPGETEEDGYQTIRFIEENTDRISYYVIGILMVMPGSKMYETPQQFGVTSLTFEENPLMTPDPVWKSDIRMSSDSLKRLYTRLNQLENVYMINDYPYAGSLSTNHSFLYFTKGPDILKQLKINELSYYQMLYSLSNHPKNFDKTVLRRNIPFTVHHSSAGDYLITPTREPLPVSEVEKHILNRTDGKRNVKRILKKLQNKLTEKDKMFLFSLLYYKIISIKSERQTGTDAEIAADRNVSEN